MGSGRCLGNLLLLTCVIVTVIYIHFHSATKMYNLCWHGTAEGCHFWLVLLSVEATLHTWCTVGQKETEKLCSSQNKYTSVYDITYVRRDCIEIIFLFPFRKGDSLFLLSSRNVLTRYKTKLSPLLHTFN